MIGSYHLHQALMPVLCNTKNKTKQKQKHPPPKKKNKTKKKQQTNKKKKKTQKNPQTKQTKQQPLKAKPKAKHTRIPLSHHCSAFSFSTSLTEKVRGKRWRMNCNEGTPFLKYDTFSATYSFKKKNEILIKSIAGENKCRRPALTSRRL